MSVLLCFALVKSEDITSEFFLEKKLKDKPELRLLFLQIRMIYNEQFKLGPDSSPFGAPKKSLVKKSKKVRLARIAVPVLYYKLKFLNNRTGQIDTKLVSEHNAKRLYKAFIQQFKFKKPIAGLAKCYKMEDWLVQVEQKVKNALKK